MSCFGQLEEYTVKLAACSIKSVSPFCFGLLIRSPRSVFSDASHSELGHRKEAYRMEEALQSSPENNGLQPAAGGCADGPHRRKNGVLDPRQCFCQRPVALCKRQGLFVSGLVPERGFAPEAFGACHGSRRYRRSVGGSPPSCGSACGCKASLASCIPRGLC
jgi:hypothetical protein